MLPDLPVRVPLQQLRQRRGARPDPAGGARRLLRRSTVRLTRERRLGRTDGHGNDSTPATRTLISPASAAHRAAGKIIYWTVLTVVVVVFTLVFLGPLYWMVTGGAQVAAGIVADPADAVPAQPPPRAPTPRRGTQLRLGAAAVEHALYAFGALAVPARLRRRRRRTRCPSCGPIFGNVVLGMMLATLMIPATRAGPPAVPDRAEPAALALATCSNTPWAIWLPAVANAFNIFLLKRFFDSIPNDLLTRPPMDGAGAAAHAVVDRAADVPADPRGRLDLRDHHGLEGLPLAAARACPAPQRDAERRHQHRSPPTCRTTL